MHQTLRLSEAAFHACRSVRQSVLRLLEGGVPWRRCRREQQREARAPLALEDKALPHARLGRQQARHSQEMQRRKAAFRHMSSVC
ncbi:MAG TPA: hypothetical protein V6D19_22665 [Stenomitos sp.]